MMSSDDKDLLAELYKHDFEPIISHKEAQAEITGQAVDRLHDLTSAMENWHPLTVPFRVERGESLTSSSSSSNQDTWNSTPCSYGSMIGAPGVYQRSLPVLKQPIWRTSEYSMATPPSCTFNNQVVPSVSQGKSARFPLPNSQPVGRDFFERSGKEEMSPLVPNRPPSAASSPAINANMMSFRSSDVSRMGRQARVAAPPPSKAAMSVPVNAVWSGTLPPRNAKESAFSCKVFLGGVPWDITEKDLIAAFGDFGNLRIEWPGIHDKQRTRMPKGHLYLIFENESSVKYLLGACNYDYHHGQHNWFYRVASKRMLVKSVQVIPWQLADASYAHPGAVSTAGASKIFVANLHGMITAEGLGRIMNDLFGGVIAATLDTDKTKYPIGSGRITFNNFESHMKAIRAGTVEIRTAKFSRQIKIDPYLEDNVCSMCHNQMGPFFCRDLECFSYFCYQCWQWQHADGPFAGHQAMVRPARAASSEEDTP